MANTACRMMRLYQQIPYRLIRSFSVSTKYRQEAQPLELPRSDSEPTVLSPKIENLLDEITKLNLIEVAELNSALKKRLNLPDLPMMGVGAPTATAAPAEEEVEAPKIGKSSFTVKLNKFDEKKKVALIKEVKGMMEDMNLVQAKKFVESVPIVLKADISKDEAEKLKETLEKIGAEVSIH